MLNLRRIQRKGLISFMRKQQLNGETDYAFMKQKICEEAGLVHLDEEDLKILWSSEGARFVLATAEGLRKAVCKPNPISSEEELG